MKKDIIYKRMRNKRLSKYACSDNKAITLKKDEEDFRPRFFRDADRIIYSLSYTRYIDKTQVFTFTENDNISKRITHVQFVSKIARTIGRALELNEDLIEAASLGHDLGHPPFGHCGEKALSELSLKYEGKVFAHNVQSVRTLMDLENNGDGKNISVQVLDAILCHNGELLEETYYPVKKSKDEFLEEYNKCYDSLDNSKIIHPMTLEGCVVRISDIVSYAGKDIEDAIRLGIIKKEDIPKSITDILGDNNAEIVNTLVTDIIDNSYNKPYIKLSKEVFNALNLLIQFNYEHIYHVINAKEEVKYYAVMYEKLFESYLKALENKDLANDIYSVFFVIIIFLYNQRADLKQQIQRQEHYHQRERVAGWRYHGGKHKQHHDGVAAVAAEKFTTQYADGRQGPCQQR